MGIKDQTSLVFYYEILRSIPMLASDWVLILLSIQLSS
jgi:hypothetical protein